MLDQRWAALMCCSLERGRQMDFYTTELSIDRLLLDPNNYRFFDMPQYASVDPKRIHENTVQQKAETLVELDGKDELRSLKESIETNGYVPLESLVVRPYDFQDDRYVVVEGNRRVKAIRWLLDDCKGGSPIPQSLVDSFNKLPVIKLASSDENESIQKIIMGLRHVSGIKQWGGYQRARLIVEMVDKHGYVISEGAKVIGMSPREALRRYRAFKALEQMQQDDEFGDYSSPNMYRLFHEAVSITLVSANAKKGQVLGRP